MSEHDPKDPRFRNWRRGTLAVYLAVAVSFSGLVIYSVVRSVLQMRPPRPVPVSQALPVAECAAEARRLLGALEAQRADFSTSPATHAERRFTDFRARWLADARGVEARCGVGGAGREPVTEAFTSLERLLDLYTTAAVQYSGAVGPTADTVRRRLEALER